MHDSGPPSPHPGQQPPSGPQRPQGPQAHQAGPPSAPYGPPGQHGPAGQRPPGRKPRSVGKILAWVGCGCATVLLLVVGGGGVGAAYYLGWFGPEDVYATPPPSPCELLDVEAAREIAGNAEDLEVYESEYLAVFQGEALECSVWPGWEAEAGHGVRLRVGVFYSERSGLEMQNGTEAAERYYGSFVNDPDDSYEFTSSTCPNGEPVITGTDDMMGGDYGLAMHRRDNLVLATEIETEGEYEHTLDEQERVQTAKELLCDAMTRL